MTENEITEIELPVHIKELVTSLRVVVLPIEEEQRTASGLIIPTEAQTTSKGVVLAIGKGVNEDFNIGDVVHFGKMNGVSYTLKDWRTVTAKCPAPERIVVKVVYGSEIAMYIKNYSPKKSNDVRDICV